EPVRADADAYWRFTRQPGLGFTHGIEVGGADSSIFGGLTDDVAGALVGGEVVEGAPVGGLADAGFPRAITPLDDVVSGAKATHGAEMISIGLAGVAGMSLGQAEEVCAATAHVAIPEPERRSEFGVVPRMTAPIVVPDVPRGGVRVDEV